jgi:hypothetical protein
MRRRLPSTRVERNLVAKTIEDLGFSGYVSYEFGPAEGHGPVQSLKQAVEIMDV